MKEKFGFLGRVTLLYVALSVAWIVLTDRTLEWLVHDPQSLTGFQTLKGLAFVAGSALFLFFLLQRALRRHARASEALQQSERRFHELFEHSPVALWSQDFSRVKAHFDALGAAGVSDFSQHFDRHPEQIDRCASLIEVLDMNAAALDLYGAERKDQLRGRVDQFFTEETRALFRDELVAIAGGARHFEGEGVNRTLAGERIHVHLTWSVAPGYEDTWGKVILSITDITERKRAEAALRESEAKFRSLAEHSPSMIFINQGGRVVYANEQCERLMGYARSEFYDPGFDFLSLVAPDSREQVRLNFERHARGEELPPQDYALLTKDGRRIEAIHTTRLIRYEGERAILGIVTDITERKRVERQLAHLASHDLLTNLYNRRRFEEELEHTLAQARRYGVRGALLWMDLDQFKQVNDSLGHQAGDELLVGLGTLLTEGLRDADVAARFGQGEDPFLARLGGDEFAVLLPHTDAAGAQEVAERLLEAVKRHTLSANGQPVRVTTSIGVALFPEHGLTLEELLSRADQALYRAKEAGRNCARIYAPDEEHKRQGEPEVAWAQRIRSGLEADRFELYAQPILELATGVVNRYELLLRLRGEADRLYFPGAFLSVAERFGLMQDLNRWVVRRAVRMLASLQGAAGGVVLEVNLSGKAFNDDVLLDLIRDELEASGVAPERLVFEMTETAAVVDFYRARAFIAQLKALGCRFALDDFGVGFSSFYALKQLPFDYLKIDGGFIQNLHADPNDEHLVRAMVQVARGLGKRTVAEFVEDEATLARLREIGVDFAQGYYIGRPAPLERYCERPQSTPPC